MPALRLLIASLLLITAVAAADEPAKPRGELAARTDARPLFRYPEARHGKGELKYVQGIPVLTLAGTPEEIGTQMGLLALKPALTEFNVNAFIDEALQAIGGPKMLPWAKATARLLEPRFPREYLREIDAAAKASGLDRDLLVLGHMLGDVGLYGCSTLLVDPQRSATGKPLFGRNLDFPPLAGLDRLSLLIVCRPEGKPAFASVGFPGLMIGTSTINSAGLAWTMNSIYSAADGSTRVNPFGTPLVVWLRRLTEECTDRATAEKLIRDTSRTGMLSLSVCDKIGGAVFEITPKSVVMRPPIDGLCACTNHFLSKELCTHSGRCWRYPRLEANQKLPKLGIAEIAKSLHAVHQGRMTIQTMIFEPDALKLHLAIGRGPASAQPLQEIDLAPLLRPLAKADDNR
jgi:isopenicillin-N N-acyltransferase like protein